MKTIAMAAATLEAALEATEEAVYNSLLQATTGRSSKGTVQAIPIDRVREILKKHAIRPRHE